MVRLLSMKRRLNCLKPLDDQKTTLTKRFKEKRVKIIKQSITKLKKIHDAEQCLRQAVLIRNTYHSVKKLSADQIQQHLEEEKSEKENIIQSICDETASEQSPTADIKELFESEFQSQPAFPAMEEVPASSWSLFFSYFFGWLSHIY